MKVIMNCQFSATRHRCFGHQEDPPGGLQHGRVRRNVSAQGTAPRQRHLREKGRDDFRGF